MISVQDNSPIATVNAEGSLDFIWTIDNTSNTFISAVDQFIDHSEFKRSFRVNGLPQLAFPRHVSGEGEIVGTRWVASKEERIAHLYAPIGKGNKVCKVPTDMQSSKPEMKKVLPWLDRITHIRGRGNKSRPVPYFVGPLPPELSELGSILSPGARLREIFGEKEVPGVTTTYCHMGEASSGTGFHIEDFAMRSCNISLWGYKVWVIIPASEKSRFEAAIENSALLYRKEKCEQWVRHASIACGPSWLKAKEIEFEILCAGPGEAVLTGPNEYHFVANYGANIAISINFLLSRDDISKEVDRCQNCGNFSI